MIASQGQEPFWLDLTDESDHVRWTLHFGLMSFGRGRDLRDGVELMTTPEEGAWRVVLEGTAVLEEGELRAAELTPSG